MKGASVAVTTSAPVIHGLGGHDWKYKSMTGQTGDDPATWGTFGGPKYPNCAGNKQSPIDVVSTKLEIPQVDVGKVVNHLYELDITGDLINTNRHVTYQVKEGLRPYISGGPLDSK